MKNQILTLILGAAVFATSPAFAMDETTDAPKGPTVRRDFVNGKCRLVRVPESDDAPMKKQYNKLSHIQLAEEMTELRSRAALGDVKAKKKLEQLRAKIMQY